MHNFAGIFCYGGHNYAKIIIMNVATAFDVETTNRSQANRSVSEQVTESSDLQQSKPTVV